MAITLKDVASIAGVSTATVSRALAGSARVSPQTADHVRSIASDLGYRYDNVARALRQKRSNLIGMVAPDYRFPYARELLHALNQELFQDELVLAPVSSFGSVPQELAQVERLLGQRVDALIIVPVDAVNSAAAIEIALEEDIPVFQLFGQARRAQTLDFQLDYVAGIEFALRSLRRGGARAIAYIDDGRAFAAQSKFNACQQVMSRVALEEFSLIPLKHSGALLKSASSPPVDMIICSGKACLRILVDRSKADSASGRFPVLLSLDPVESSMPVSSLPVVSLEFSTGALAKRVVESVNAALSNKNLPAEPVRIQPFLNMSRR